MNIGDGRYQIREQIGAGGMGTVYRGVDTQSGEIVAVKLLKPEIVATDPHMLARFAREGEALRQLNHPNIVKVLATAEDNNQHYIVMELVGGGSLENLLKSGDLHLPINQVLRIALELADALTRAHHLNIIHRDIKPANVLIADDGTPRLTDFGIAYMSERERVTKTDSVIGTLDYLSPEAFSGEGIDARTDIWAFGVLLFEMLTGQRPFDRPAASQTIMAILTEPPPDLEAIRSDCPIALVDLVYRMLEKDRNQRIPSVRQVGAELENILRGRSSSRPASPTGEGSPRSMEWGEEQGEKTRLVFDTPTPALDMLKHNLPKQPTPFVGRESEISELTQLINNPQVQLVTILAPGGMGKTRLALEVAGNFVNTTVQPISFINGIYLIQLAPLSSAENILPTIADAVGFQFYPGGEPKQQLLDFFREKNMLLIMDNFEHVLDGATLVSDILQGAPNVKIIATSRERLNLRGETIFTIGGMDFPDWETPEDALQYSAVKLFLQSARRAQPGFELNADDLTYVARICRMVLGMPLGIELAAAWVDSLSLNEIAGEIGQSLDFLESEARDMPERHRSIRAVFDYSWGLLGDEEKVNFTRLAVFKGGFSRQAAQNVSGASLKLLTALVNKSLLKRNPDSGVYQIHELLRQYADEMLEQSGEVDKILEAHSDYYLNVLHLRQRDLEGGKQIETLKDIEFDIENVRAAWLWAAKNGKIEMLDKALHSLWLYYEIRGLNVEGQVIFEQAVTLLRETSPDSKRDELLGHLLARQSNFSISLYERDKSKRLLEESAAFLTDGTSAYARAFLNYSQGWFHMNGHVGETVKARPFLMQALKLYQDMPRRWETAYMLLNLGRSYWYRLDWNDTDYPEAKRLLDEALTLQKDMGDIFGLSLTLLNLGVVVDNLYQPQEAIRLSQESLQLRRRLGNLTAIVSALNNLGLVAVWQGNFAEAYLYFEERLQVCREIGNVVEIVWALNAICNQMFREGDFTRARDYIEEAMALVEGTEHDQWIITTTFSTARLDLAQGAYAESEARFERVKEFYQTHNIRGELHYIRIFLGYTTLPQGKMEAARAHIGQSLQMAQEDNHPSRIAYSRVAMGKLERFGGDYGSAREHLEAYLRYLMEREKATRAAEDQENDAQVSMIALSALADVDCIEGSYDTAQQHIAKALTVARSFSSVPWAMIALVSAANLYAAKSQPDRAAELASLVHHHPKAYAEDKGRAAKLLDSLKTQLAPDVYAAAVERGKLLDLEAMVSELLTGEKW